MIMRVVWSGVNNASITKSISAVNVREPNLLDMLEELQAIIFKAPSAKVMRLAKWMDCPALVV